MGAWTLTPQGARIPVLPQAIRDRAEDNSGGVTALSDTRVRVIVFPRVSVGSVVTYQATSMNPHDALPGRVHAVLRLLAQHSLRGLGTADSDASIEHPTFRATPDGAKPDCAQ